MNKLISYAWILMIVTGFLAGFYWNTGKLFSQTLQAQENSSPVINQAPIIMEHNSGELLEETPLPKTKILFVGDIMLDRDVEKLSEKYGINYPFEKIKDFFSGYDMVSVNLEGPIVKTPKETTANSLQFSFASESAELLADNHINIVSLANNHILNMGQAGLKQTREYLEEAGIGFAGDPIKCGAELAYKKGNIIFLSFNQTFSFSCKDSEFASVVKEIKKKNPNQYLAINMHWGKEYQLTNTETQANLAHVLIDSGADLIIGHHPHVVENIELYKNKLIFYSLGNFIFDQYFNQKVQQGLAIDLEIDNNKAIYQLHPLISQKSQPTLMNAEDANKFLLDLARVSSIQLGDSVKSGQIILKK